MNRFNEGLKMFWMVMTGKAGLTLPLSLLAQIVLQAVVVMQFGFGTPGSLVLGGLFVALHCACAYAVMMYGFMQALSRSMGMRSYGLDEWAMSGFVLALVGSAAGTAIIGALVAAMTPVSWLALAGSVLAGSVLAGSFIDTFAVIGTMVFKRRREEKEAAKQINDSNKPQN